jgi:hypothetical protein
VSVAVNWPDAASPIQVSLFRPDGTPVNPGDSDLHLKTDGTHRVYRLNGPAGGRWELRLGAQEGQDAAEYLAIVSANTDVTMLLNFGLRPWERVPGAQLPIYVVLVDEVGPITGANVQVSIQRPGGAIHALNLYDDGTHGDASPDDGVYSNEYPISRPGSHHVKARALGTAHDGELFQRHLLRHVRVPVRPRVAYVWDADSAKAAQVKALLDGNELLVDLVNMADLKSTDLAPYQLLIVGPDTGLEAVWGDATSVAHLRDSGKPVLGLGDGGHAFFGKLSLALGYSNGTPKADAEVHAVDPAHTVWSQPYDLVLGGAAPLLAVYQAPASPGVAVNLDQVPPDVEVLAQRPSEPNYAWLAREKSRFLLWGFNGGPATMTVEGRELLVNTVYCAFP